MNCYDAVRAAGNPRDAMLALAKAIDARFEEVIGLMALKKPVDDWEQPWAADDTPVRPITLTVTQAPRADQIQELLAGNLDGEDRRALEAELRLLTDGLRPVSTEVDAGKYVVTDGDDVVYPAADIVRQTDRRTLWEAFDLEGYLTEPVDNALEAFITGGPMWLYDFDRDGVAAMPRYVISAMLDNDVAVDSPLRAQEMGRDLLRVDTEDAKAHALQVANDDLG